MITLIGMGSGTPESLTAQGLAALQNAGLILGAKRLLEQLPQGCTEHRKALYQPEDVLAALAADPEVDAALVYSGDTGFYSGAAQLLPMLRAFGISCRVLPGLSSVTFLVVTLGTIWSFQVFDLVYTMTGGGPGTSTVTLVLTTYNAAFKEYNMGYASAVAMLMFVFVLAVSGLQKLLLKGGED